jgi:hypothetical protein
MRFKKLRIAWSVGCGILCLLLVALSIRSYWRADWISRFDKNELQTSVGVNRGTFIYSEVDWSTDPAGHVAPHGWTYRSTQASASQEKRWVSWGSGSYRISHWLLTLPLAALAAAPWIHWRFRLRMLLIVTTLVAAIVAIAVASN